jgi:DNA-binding NarL/FixJ family response regulator
MRVMVVDDHFVVRSGLVASLELEEGIEVVAEADSGEAALGLYAEARPDVLLMDLQLPGWNGIETGERLLELDPGARILVFSTFARDDEIQAALDGGALGYLQKTAGREELLGALRRVAAGGRYLAPEIEGRLAGLRLGPAVTLREREVLALVARGRANKEIAAELGISEDTVKRHVSNVLQKLGASDRAQATAEAIRRGIVKVEP